MVGKGIRKQHHSTSQTNYRIMGEFSHNVLGRVSMVSAIHCTIVFLTCLCLGV